MLVFMLIVALPGGIPSGNALVSLSGYGKGQGWVIPGNQAEVWVVCLSPSRASFLCMIDHNKVKKFTFINFKKIDYGI